MPTVGVKGLPILATVGYSMYVNVSTVGYSLPILATVGYSMYVCGCLLLAIHCLFWLLLAIPCMSYVTVGVLPILATVGYSYVTLRCTHTQHKPTHPHASRNTFLGTHKTHPAQPQSNPNSHPTPKQTKNTRKNMGLGAAMSVVVCYGWRGCLCTKGGICGCLWRERRERKLGRWRETQFCGMLG